jgi:hypothetical protein
MAGAVWYADHALGQSASSPSAVRLAMLAALIGLGVAVYSAVLGLLGVVTLKDLALPRERT